MRGASAEVAIDGGHEPRFVRRQQRLQPGKPVAPHGERRISLARERGALHLEQSREIAHGDFAAPRSRTAARSRAIRALASRRHRGRKRRTRQTWWRAVSAWKGVIIASASSRVSACSHSVPCSCAMRRSSRRWTMRGGRFADGAVLIRGRRIEAVGPASALPSHADEVHRLPRQGGAARPRQHAPPLLPDAHARGARGAGRRPLRMAAYAVSDWARLTPEMLRVSAHDGDGRARCCRAARRPAITCTCIRTAAASTTPSRPRARSACAFTRAGAR